MCWVTQQYSMEIVLKCKSFSVRVCCNVYHKKKTEIWTWTLCQLSAKQINYVSGCDWLNLNLCSQNPHLNIIFYIGESPGFKIELFPWPDEQLILCDYTAMLVTEIMVYNTVMDFRQCFLYGHWMFGYNRNVWTR